MSKRTGTLAAHQSCTETIPLMLEQTTRRGRWSVKRVVQIILQAGLLLIILYGVICGIPYSE